MASLTDLGGLFFQCGLIPDKNSFETGYRLIDGTVNKFSMLIGTARNAANVMTAFATDAGKTDSALYKTSLRLGMTAETLSTWKAAAKIAGVSAEGLVSSIGELDYALNNIRSEGFAKYADQLSKIGMSMDQLKDKEGKWLSGDKAVKKILEFTLERYNSAETDEQKKQIGYGLYDAMGDAVYNLFAELVRTGVPVDELLSDAGATQFQTNDSMNKGSNFMKEWNKFKESLGSISNLLGDELGGALTKRMEQVNDWLTNNGDAIKKAIDNIAGFVEKIANSALLGDLGKMAGATIKLLGGDTEGALEELRDTNLSKQATQQQATQQKIDNYRKENGGAFWWMSLYNIWDKNFPEDLRDEILSQDYRFSGITYNKPKNKMDDGIMRPDGTITKVAPDDWVLAARDLGDLARAFIPQNMTSAAGNTEVSIVQNFTINGGSDMPQVLRQQAYQGTQDALMLMQQSSNRLQLMSGTR